MSLPSSFEKRLEKNKVCRLKKSLYGLKQYPRAWFEHLRKVVKRHGYCQSQVDQTMFYKHSRKGKLLMWLI